jgi:GTPase
MVSNNIRIGVCGNVDAGKSTLIGVLCNNELDDGKGSARMKVLKHVHERTSGRTTNISFNYLHYKDRTCTLVDLAGHEKYLKTTLYGITGSELHYGLIIVGANMDITKMTKEHLGILLFLRIPIIVLITKIDMVPEHKYEDTKEMLMKMLKLPRFKKHPLVLNNDIIDEYISNIAHNTEEFKAIIPIIPISSKSGTNIANLRKIIELLPINNINITDNLLDHPIISNAKVKSDVIVDKYEYTGSVIYIESNYVVQGIGIVLVGYVMPGKDKSSIKKNQILYLGPLNTTNKSDNIKDKFIEIKIKSMHNSKRMEVTETLPGDHIIMAVKAVDSKIKLTRDMFYKGIVALSNIKDCIHLQFEIKVQLQILNYKAVIKKDYCPVIHCHTIRQAALITDVLNETNIIQTGQNAPVIFKMTKYPVFIKPGDIIYIRDGNTKGVGVVI